MQLISALKGLVIPTPSSPAAGSRALYPKSDGWYDLDSSGNEFSLNRYSGVQPTSSSYIGHAQATVHGSTAMSTSGACSWMPVTIGPKARTADRIAVNVGTAAVAGTTPALRLGIYLDNGASSGPGTLLLDAGTVTITATGIQSATISQLLAPGLYWLAALYTFAVAPTTALSAFQVTTAVGLPGSTWTNNYKGFTQAAVAAGAMPANGTSAAIATAGVVSVGLRLT